MKKFIGLRYSLLFALLPMVLIIISLVATFNILEAQSALTGLANKHIAYKAEELRDFAYSEWETIKTLQLEDNLEMKGVVQQSLLSYSRTLLREKSEAVLLLNKDKQIVAQVSLRSEGNEVLNDTANHIDYEPGWLNFTWNGEERVGILFEYTPLESYFILSDLKSTFFQEIKQMERNSLIILLIASLLVLIFIPLTIRPLIRRIEVLSITAFEITKNLDLSKRVESIPDDETGVLAQRFNQMLEALQESNRELDQKRIEESLARKAAEEQEKEALFLMSQISDIRDEDTGNHLKRIGLFSRRLAKLIGLSEEEQMLLFNAAPLHDIGKIGVPDAVLLKRGKLDEEEMAIMKQHTSKGHELLKSSRSQFLQQGALIALSHHEKWDGTGYPLGINGEDIPLYGRLVSIVDVFDALLSERPYKKPFTQQQTYELIESQKGIQFDPQLTEVFLQHYEHFCEIYKMNS